MIIINPIDKKDNKCFQYVATVALNHDEIKKDLQAITTKIKTFIMFCMLKKEERHPVYVSKHNSNREKQVILLIIPNGEKFHYLSVKKLSAFL